MEVFLNQTNLLEQLISLLHVRGGVSSDNAYEFRVTKSPPRTWRCFYSTHCNSYSMFVFSTYVEVFPFKFGLICGFCGLLHVRGGVSARTIAQNAFGLSSPRTWRCF